MDLEFDEVICVLGVVLCCQLMLQANRRARRFKTRPINRQRKKLGFYKTYFLPMKANDSEQFFKYTRMDVATFNKLLQMVTPKLIKQRRLPDSIGAEERLALTLHYFSQGSSMQTIAWTYQMGHSTVHYIVVETAKAIWDVLAEEYLKPPSTEEDWLRIAADFEGIWNFPNCIGALDGKHISIQAPAKSGSKFFNYKKSFSIVLLASCDAKYNFTLVDIGAYGSESDGGIFKNSLFGSMFDANHMNVPQPRRIKGSNIIQPFAMVADEAFPLKTYIMRPYPGRNLDAGRRIFNYRLLRARRCIENAFGILVNRWRLLKTIIQADVKNIDDFVKAMVCLHNYVKKELEKKNDTRYCPPGFVDTEVNLGDWRQGVDPLQSVGRLAANRAGGILYNTRDLLKDFFLSPAGQIPWQNKVLDDGFTII